MRTLASSEDSDETPRNMTSLEATLFAKDQIPFCPANEVQFVHERINLSE